MTGLEPAASVDRGAAVLDRVKPGWFDETLVDGSPGIDLARLRTVSTCLCVIGQLFDRYLEGIVKLFPDCDSTELALRAAAHGFTLFESAPIDDPRWRELDGWWRVAIEKRRRG